MHRCGIDTDKQFGALNGRRQFTQAQASGQHPNFSAFRNIQTAYNFLKHVLLDIVGGSGQYDILPAVEQKLYDGGVFAVFPTFEMPARPRVQQHIIFAAPTLLTQFLLHAFPCILCHPKAHFGIGYVFRLDKRREDIQLVFNDMMAGIQLMVDKIMTETPPETVALDAVQTHAATGAQFGDYCRTPLVGQVESPVIIACLQL